MAKFEVSCTASFPFHHPHPAAHCTSSYPEDSRHLRLRKTFLNGLHDSPAKIFLSFRRQRARILVSHHRHTSTLFSGCHLYYAPIRKTLEFLQHQFTKMGHRGL